MKTHLPIVLFLLLFTVPQYAQNAAIKSVNAYLYYNQDGAEKKAGQHSEDIFTSDDYLFLLNVFMGDGRGGWTNNTLVEVEISGTYSDYNDRIRLTVTGDKKKLILKQEQRYVLSTEDNCYLAPFLLYDTGCETLHLKAELIRKGKPLKSQVVEKDIMFECGE